MTDALADKIHDYNELTCVFCGNPMIVLADGTTQHLVPGSMGIDEVDYDQNEDHAAIPDIEKQDEDITEDEDADAGPSRETSQWPPR